MIGCSSEARAVARQRSYGFMWVALLAAGVPPLAAAQGMPPTLTTYLTQAIQLNQDQMQAAENGTPVVKMLDSPDKREVAVFGIVAIGVPRAFYVRRTANVPLSLRDPSRPALKLFSNPAKASDVAKLALPHGDVEDLQNCEPGSCKVKLSSKGMAELRAALDTSKAPPDSVVNAYYRRHVVSYVEAYRAKGNAALIEYADKDNRTALAQVLDSLMSRATYLYEFAPSLEKYLKSAPKERPPDMHEAISWVLEGSEGVKPTLFVSHEMAYDPPEFPGSTLIASKQLYANHYFDGAIKLLAVVDRASSAARADSGIYVVAVQRLHFDDLPGGIRNIRGKVVGMVRDRMTTALRDGKARTEQAYAKAKD